MNLIRRLLEEVSNVEVLPEHEPKSEVATNDTVTGEPLPEELRKLHILLGRKQRLFEMMATVAVGKSNELIMEFGANGKWSDEQNATYDAMAKEQIIQLGTVRREVRVLEQLFWAELRCSYLDIIYATSVGIRKGWLVVSTKEEGGDCECTACQLRSLAVPQRRQAIMPGPFGILSIMGVDLGRPE